MRRPVNVKVVVWGATALLGCSSSSATSDGGADAPSDSGVSDARTADGPRDGGIDVAPADAGGPFLTSLSVSWAEADAAPPLVLVPAFSPGINDYYVRCVAGSNALQVSMAASPGASSSLLQPSASPSAPKQTLKVAVAEGAAVVAVATLGAATNQYWVRCLPHDFPVFQWVPHPEAGARTPGYYLVGNDNTMVGAYATVLDNNGVPVWFHEMTAGAGAENVDSLAPGAISFTARDNATPYEIHQINPSGPTTYVTAPERDEHELRLLDGGDYLLLSDPLLGGVDLTGLVVPLSGGGSRKLGADQYILDCVINQVVPSTGAIVWTWTAIDHLDPRTTCTYPEVATPTGQSTPDGGLIIDVFHCNSIDVDPHNGNLLVSARDMDSVFYVEVPSGRVLWKMGGTNSTKDDAGFVPVPDPFHRQHDARLQPSWTPACAGGAGQISMYDDETGLAGPARAVLYDVTVDPTDAGVDCGAAGDGGSSGATVAWQYGGELSAEGTGSFRIEPDGTRVINWGFGGTPNLIFTEVDIAGNDKLDFYYSADYWSYRTVKVPLSQFDLSALRATAGMP